MKMTLTVITIMLCLQLSAPPNNASVIFASEGVNPFQSLWIATTIVESGGNPFAYSATDQKGGSWGIVQIGQSMLNAFNAENGTNFVPKDCYGVSVSKRIFMWHFQKQYPNIEAASRSYNGGTNWAKKQSTKKYYLKIQKALLSL